MVQRMNPDMRRRGAMTFPRPSAVLVRATLAAAALVALLSFTLWVLAPARASAQGSGGAVRQACAADYRRVCAGVSVGDGRVRKCLNDNFAGLSEACKQAIGSRAGK